MRQGQSGATKVKEACFQICLRYELSKIPQASDYFIFDLNCGDGHNADAHSRSSSVLARDSIKRFGFRSKVFLVDKSTRALNNICQREWCRNGHLFDPRPDVYSEDIRMETFGMDNRTFVPMIPDLLRREGVEPRRAHGIIIADPNGLDVPQKEIGAVVREARLLSVAIHISGLLRVARYYEKHPNTKYRAVRAVTSLSEIFINIQKDYWLISEPFRSDGHGSAQHHILFGSHIWLPPVKKKDWGLPAMIDPFSSDGVRIIRTIEH